MRFFPPLITDSYKLGHPVQYPDLTEFVYANWTGRGSRIGLDHYVHFGPQAFLYQFREAYARDFFGGDIEDIGREYERRANMLLGPGDYTEAVDRLHALHDLAYLPLRFCSLPEGTVVPLRVPALTVENTHPDFYWMTNNIETWMSSAIWLPSTSATIARQFRLKFEEYCEFTGGEPYFIQFAGHDFSMRGMSSLESAAASGAGHLTSFIGSDTLIAVEFIEQFYGGYDPNTLISASVPATEHSVMCAGGKVDELETFRRLVTEIYPNGVVSIVSDTWDLWKVLTEYMPLLKDEILARNGTVVVRPDSGDPVKILMGDPEATPGSPVNLGVLELLWNVFGGTTNDQGFRHLDSHVNAIYGDSINLVRQEELGKRHLAQNWQYPHEVLGIGSYSYQYHTRDDLGFAMKATWAQVDGVGHNLFKDPVTDDGEKKSATGRLAVIADNSKYGLSLIEQATPDQEAESLLQPVWQNGDFLRLQTFVDVRNMLWPV